MNNGSTRARLRQEYDFDVQKPLSPIAERCISGEISFDEAVDQFELMLAYHALKKAEGNQAEAARQLGTKRTTLQMILARIGVIPSRLPEAARERVQDDKKIVNQEAHRILTSYIERFYCADSDQLSQELLKPRGG